MYAEMCAERYHGGCEVLRIGEGISPMESHRLQKRKGRYGRRGSCSTAAGHIPSDGNQCLSHGHLYWIILPFRNGGNIPTGCPCVFVRKVAGEMFRTKKARLRRAGSIGNELLMACIRAVFLIGVKRRESTVRRHAKFGGI